MNAQQVSNPVDLFVIGGGINGCGIARDAAGRGYSVTLAEMDDLASATSSAQTKVAENKQHAPAATVSIERKAPVSF